MSISEPARKNSIARPKSARLEMISSDDTQPKAAGPRRMPKAISNTTNGMRTILPSQVASRGAAATAAGTSTIVAA